MDSAGLEARMSYVLFLFLFLCVPLVGLMHLTRSSIRRTHLLMLVVITTLSVMYTTPWDNYLAATRVRYYSPERILDINLGFAPVEEYAFFTLQALLTGWFVLWLWRKFYPVDFAEKSGEQPTAPKKKRHRGQ
jgi:lycopene cyclase domain-containing protein